MLAPLGAGGMGEVYRARDTLLGRDVAIKIISRTDAASQRRFEQEARGTAVSHSRIVKRDLMHLIACLGELGDRAHQRLARQRALFWRDVIYFKLGKRKDLWWS
ncbi:MAG: hypothetical protein DMF59_14240 [Acidobacteria bacterium]|nr:MAG: hypothetical protein DMF59_14240 [Acidobacteriota bacterium]